MGSHVCTMNRAKMERLYKEEKEVGGRGCYNNKAVINIRFFLIRLSNDIKWQNSSHKP